MKKINDLKAREPNFLSSIQAITRERDGLLAQLEAMRKERDSALFERDNLIRSLQDMKAHLAELKEAYGRINPELNQARVTIASLENEVKKLGDLLAAKQQENKALQSRIVELESARMELDHLRTLIEKVTQERDNLAKVLSVKENEIANLKRELSKYASDIQAKNAEIGQITHVEEELASDVNTLQLELKKRDKTIEDLVFRQNELKTKELKLVESIEVIRREKEGVLPQLEALRAENQRLKSELDRLLPDRENLLSSLDKKESQIALLNNDFNKIARENKDLIAIIADLEKKRDSVLYILQEREVETRRLKDLLDKSFPELESLREKVKLYGTENARLTDLTREQEKEIAALRAQLQDVTDLESRIKELSRINAQLREQLGPFERMKAEFAQLQQQIDSLVTKRDSLLAALQEREAEINRLKSMISDNQSLKSRLDADEQEIQRLMALHSKDQDHINELEAMIANLQSSIRSQKELSVQNEKLLQDNAFLRQRIQELENSLAAFTNKYKKLETAYYKIKGVAANLEDVHEKLVETCEETQRIDTALKSTDIQSVSKSGQYFEKMTQEKDAVAQRPYHQSSQRF